jgi:hypothetical protein
MAGTYDITCEQGATFQRVITWKNSAGNPINVTGYSAVMQVRDGACAQPKIIELSTTNGRIVTGGALGTITLTISAADSDDLPVGQFVYDLEMTNAGNVTRLLEGSFTVTREVTR